MSIKEILQEIKRVCLEHAVEIEQIKQELNLIKQSL